MHFIYLERMSKSKVVKKKKRGTAGCSAGPRWVGWGWRGGREVQEEGDICTGEADSLCYTAENNSTVK